MFVFSASTVRLVYEEIISCIRLVGMAFESYLYRYSSLARLDLCLSTRQSLKTICETITYSLNATKTRGTSGSQDRISISD